MDSSRAKSKRINTGDTVPDFSLPDQNGREVRLFELLQTGPVVLYFYPKDDSPGCTAEACGFRDSHAVFADAGAHVVGVSGDSPESHARFAEKHGLPFLLLSDRDGVLRRLFGVPTSLGVLPGRVTYVIGRDGKVHTMFNSQLNPQRHIQEALRTLEGI